MVTYREASFEDVRCLVNLHKKYIYWGFLTSLGEGVLRWIYHSLMVYSNSVVIVAEEDGRVVGAVTGVISLKAYYFFFFKKYFFKIAPQLIKNLSSIRKILETLIYPTKTESVFSLPKEELLTVIVEKDQQGKKIAQGLFDELRKWFQDRDILTFKTTVGENNLQSIRFFQKLGCKEVGVGEIHKDERSRIFICK